jgi:hypothetical protein
MLQVVKLFLFGFYFHFHGDDLFFIFEIGLIFAKVQVGFMSGVVLLVRDYEVDA